MKRALIIDCETTTLDPKTGTVIEIGAILYSITNQTSLISFSTLLYSPTNEAERINRISPAALAEIEENYPPKDGVFPSLIADADVIVAHNAAFDRSWLSGYWHSRPWVCTKDGFTWPQQDRPGMSLVSLALAHGIGVASAHRALTDCNLIAELFSRMTDLPAMFERAMRPKLTYQSLQPFDQNQVAKNHGFAWNQDRKIWMRTMAIEDVAALPFRVREVVP